MRAVTKTLFAPEPEGPPRAPTPGHRTSREDPASLSEGNPPGPGWRPEPTSALLHYEPPRSPGVVAAAETKVAGGSSSGATTYLMATHTGSGELGAEYPESWRVPVHAQLTPDCINPEDIHTGTGSQIECMAEILLDSTVGRTAGAQTDATVWVELVGTGADGETVSSGRQVLAAVETGRNIFRPSERNEFTFSAARMEHIHSCTVGHDNDGADNVSSLWKLDRIVVTCIQDEPIKQYETQLGEPSLTTGKGVHAKAPVTTTDNQQWHFVPESSWIGCMPSLCNCADYNIALHTMQKTMAQSITEHLESVREKLPPPAVSWRRRWPACLT